MIIIYDIKNVLAENTNWVQNFGNLGDGLGWTFGLLLSAFTLYIVYSTYKQQKIEIERLKQESKELWFQNFFSWVLVPKLEWLLNSIDSTTGIYNPYSELNNLTNIIHNNTNYMISKLWTETREIPPNAEKYIELWQGITDLYDFILNKINDEIQIDNRLWYKIILNQIISEKEIIWFREYATRVREWPRWTNLCSQ